MSMTHRRKASKISTSEATPQNVHFQQFVSDEHEGFGMSEDLEVTELTSLRSYESHSGTQLGPTRSRVQMSQALPSTNPYEHVVDNDGEVDDDDDDDNNDDDEQFPVWTSRGMFLGSVSCFSLLILNKFFLTRTGECIMAMATTVVILYVLGYIMSKLLPKRTVYFPTLGLELSLNPGPFTLREYAMICILANLGGTYGGITSYSVDWSHS